ncbi:hypothetical protein H6F42_04900 [Pseudanabaena sp. FACHB-1998]|nr:hypothetical protein [Pseudanabaena sp. FACHB-1998]
MFILHWLNYHDHFREIRQQISEDEAFAMEMKAKTTSLLQQKLKERYGGVN